MWESTVVRLNYSDSLEFSTLGFVHDQELYALVRPRKDAQILNHQRVASFAALNVLRHLDC